MADKTLLPKDIESKYKQLVRQVHGRSGAAWQRVKEVSMSGYDSHGAYWAHAEKQSARSDDGAVIENEQANPETGIPAGFDAATYQHNQEQQQEIVQRVRKLLDLAKQILTEQQYNVFVLVMVKDPALTEREAAKVLGVSYGRVHQLVETAREKLMRAYDERTQG